MSEHRWVKELPIVITVSDAANKIYEMNDRSVQYFADEGGDQLIGSDLLACHPEPYRTKLKRMIDTQSTNVFSFEENGQRKLVYQSPWYKNGKYAGFVEMIMVIPDAIRHSD